MKIKSPTVSATKIKSPTDFEVTIARTNGRSPTTSTRANGGNTTASTTIVKMSACGNSYEKIVKGERVVTIGIDPGVGVRV